MNLKHRLGHMHDFHSETVKNPVDPTVRREPLARSTRKGAGTIVSNSTDISVENALINIRSTSPALN